MSSHRQPDSIFPKIEYGIKFSHKRRSENPIFPGFDHVVRKAYHRILLFSHYAHPLNSVRHCLRRLCIFCALTVCSRCVCCCIHFCARFERVTCRASSPNTFYRLRLKPIVFCTICDGGLPIYYICIVY